MANRLYNKQVTPKGYKRGGGVGKVRSAIGSLRKKFLPTFGEQFDKAKKEGKKTFKSTRDDTKKGKLDQMPIWIVEIRMPKELIRTIYSGYEAEQQFNVDPANSEVVDDATPIEKADTIVPAEGE